MRQHQGEVDQVAFQGQEEEVGVEVEEEEEVEEELVKTMVETSLDYRALGVSLVKGSLNLSQHQQGGEEAVVQLGHLSKFLLRRPRVGMVGRPRQTSLEEQVGDPAPAPLRLV